MSEITVASHWTTKPNVPRRPKTVGVVSTGTMQDPPLGTAKAGEAIVVLSTIRGDGSPTFWETEADFRSMYEPEVP